MGGQLEPEILVLFCGHSVGNGRGVSEVRKAGAGFTAKAVMLPCSSKVEIGYLLKLVEHGTDGVVVVGCPERECRLMVGSTRAERRVKLARGLLQEAGMGEERLAMVRRRDLGDDEIMRLAAERASAVGALGPNPMKAAVGQPGAEGSTESRG